MEIERIINETKDYFKSICSDFSFVEEILNIDKFSDCISLCLSNVCVLKENRLREGSSNQTHIHITGNEMKFFYPDSILSSIELSTEDEKVEIELIALNLRHLEVIKAARRDISKEIDFAKITDKSIIKTSTVKKISKRKKQAPQVQISKIRCDGKEFRKFRENIFTGDRLVFLKYKENPNKYLVVGIPSTFYNKKSISYNSDNITKDLLIKETNRTSLKYGNLRKVGTRDIAKYVINDEEENEDNDTEAIFDLSKGIKTREKRKKRHEYIVTLFAELLESKGFSLYVERIDCLAVRENSEPILCEVKTLNGTISDETAQVLKAFSQVFYYENFKMGEFTGLPTQKVVVFEHKINSEHISFFEDNGILVYWIENDIICGTENAISYLYSLDIM